MREIKFRAWHKLAKRMACIDMLDFTLDAYRATAGKLSGSGHLADIELMQCTGLKDKNGKDIYEGDILRVRFGKHIVEVRWKVTGFGFFNLGTHQWQLLYVTDLKQIEVIGNIYETPELAQEVSA